MIVAGGCHCRAVRFEAVLPPAPVAALDCNCSACSMTSYLHIFVPHGDFTLLAGQAELTSYRFGTGAAEHLFCARCGVKSFYQPRTHPEAWSINARCLDVPLALTIEPFDGRDWERANAGLASGAGR